MELVRNSLDPTHGWEKLVREQTIANYTKEKGCPFLFQKAGDGPFFIEPMNHNLEVSEITVYLNYITP